MLFSFLLYLYVYSMVSNTCYYFEMHHGGGGGTFRRFRGRTLFAGMVSAPLVMPDVITGLSALGLAEKAGQDANALTRDVITEAADLVAAGLNASEIAKGASAPIQGGGGGRALILPGPRAQSTWRRRSPRCSGPPRTRRRRCCRHNAARSAGPSKRADWRGPRSCRN